MVKSQSEACENLKVDIFQYTLTCKGIKFYRTQAKFIRMNLEELFLITRIFSLKIEKYHNFKLAYGNVCDILKSLVFYFASIDA